MVKYVVIISHLLVEGRMMKKTISITVLAMALAGCDDASKTIDQAQESANKAVDTVQEQVGTLEEKMDSVEEIFNLDQFGDASELSLIHISEPTRR